MTRSRNKQLVLNDDEQRGFEKLKRLDEKYARVDAAQSNVYHNIGVYDGADVPYDDITVDTVSSSEEQNKDLNSDNGGLIDAYNLFQEKRISGDLAKSEQDLTDLHIKQQDVELAENYLKDQKRLNYLFEEIDSLTGKERQNALNEMQQLIDRLTEYDKYIQTDGRQSDVLRSLFFDTSKSTNNSATKNEILQYSTLGSRAGENLVRQSLNDISGAFSSNSIWGGAKKFLLGVSEGAFAPLVAAGDIVRNTFDSAQKGIEMALPRSMGGTKKGYNPFIDQQIKETEYPELYKDYFTSSKEILEDADKTTKIEARIRSFKKHVADDVKSKEDEIVNLSDKLLRGTWYYNPELIDPQFRKNQESIDTGLLGTITHPLYSFPELGTSFSDLEHFAELTLMDVAAGAITSGTVAKFLMDKCSTKAFAGEFLGVLGKVLANPNTRYAVAAAEGMTGVYLTNEMRKHETKQEVIDAYTNRVLNTLIDKNFDFQKLSKAVDQKWEELQLSREIQGSEKLPTPESLIDKIKLAISLGVDLDDEEYNAVLKNARKGLNKVYNENQTLAAKDYLESLVFMTYAGKTIKNAISNFLFGKGSNRLITDATATIPYTSRLEALEPYIKGGTATVVQKAEYYANKVVDNALTKVIGTNPMSRVMTARVGKFLKNKLKTLSEIAPLEGIEEGQQQLLQTRYEAGEYDDYNKAMSNFDIQSLFNDQTLGIEALSAYLGSYVGDPTESELELRRAMNIGFTTALWFGLPSVATNFVSNKTINDDNIRNLVAQLRTDNNLRKYVADTYARVEDEQKVGRFFDMYSKAGINGERMASSLEEMKKYKGGLVTDQFVDDDIKLAKETYTQYKSDVIEDFRKKASVSKNSDEHKALVQNAVRTIRDYETQLEVYNKKTEEIETAYNKLQDDLIRQIQEDVINDVVSGKRTVKATASNKTFLQKVVDDYEKYRKSYSNARMNWQTDKTQLEEAKKRLIQRGYTKEEAELYKEEEARKYIFDEYTDEERSKYGLSGYPNVSLEQYAKNRLTLLFNYKKAKLYDSLIKSLQNRSELQKIIQKETGTDVNVDSLVSIIDQLKELQRKLLEGDPETGYVGLSQLVRQQNKLVDDYNEKLLPELNAMFEQAGLKKSKKQKRVNSKTILDSFGDFDGLVDLLKSQIIQDVDFATLMTMRPRYEAYKYGMTDVDAISKSIRLPKFSELSESQKNDIIKQTRERYQAEGKKEPSIGMIAIEYNKRVSEQLSDFINLKKEWKKLQDKSRVSKQDQEFEPDDQLNEHSLMKKAAELFVQRELAQKNDNYQNRMKIYHRGYDIDSNDNSNNNQYEEPYQVEETAPFEQNEQIETPAGEMSSEMAQILNQDAIGATPAEQAAAKTLGQHNPQQIEIKPQPEQKEKKPNKGEDSTLTPVNDTNNSDTDATLLGYDRQSIEAVKKLPYQERYITLVVNGIIEDYWYNGNGRECLIANIHGVKVPIYKSTRGTDGKTKGHWYVFFGFGLGHKSPKEASTSDNNWLIKGTIDELENGYYIDELRELQDLLNEMFDWEPGSFHRRTEHDVFGKSSGEDLNKIVLGKEDSGVKNGVNSRQFIDEFLERIKDAIEADKKSSTPETNQDASVDMTQDSEEDTATEQPSQSEEEEPAEGPVEVNDSGEEVPVEIGDEIEDQPLSIEDVPFDLFDVQEDKPFEISNADDDSSSYNSQFDEDVNGGKNGRKNSIPAKDVQSKDEAEAEYLAYTFFYQPNAKEPIVLGVNGQELKTTYPLATGKELSQKLLDKSWITGCDCYYICSGNIDKKATDNKKNSITVSLIIDDHNAKKTYCCTLKTPGVYQYGSGTNQIVDGLGDIRNTLSLIGINSKNIEIIRDGKKAVRRINRESYEEAYSLALFRLYENETGNDRPGEGTLKLDPERYNKEMNWFKNQAQLWLEEHPENRAKLNDQARKSLAYTNKRILTSEQIEQQIASLIQRRNAIIEQYCEISGDGSITIPTSIKKTVRPETICISNGAFNNDEGEYGNLTRCKDFGLAEDTEEITRQIEDGEVQFGFGRGKRANDPYSISSITDPSQNFNITNSSGEAGKSGAIYIMIDTGDNTLVPVQLRPQPFKKQNGSFINSKNPLKLCIDPNTGKINSTSGVKPSIAEVILYLVCNKLHAENIPGGDQKMAQTMLDLIVNTGDKTLLDPDQRVQNDIPQLADKQIALIPVQTNGKIQYKLVMSSNIEGIRAQEVYDVEQIFSDEEVRTKAVMAISNNLHWNTEVSNGDSSRNVAMTDKFPPSLLNFLQGYFEDNPKATEYKFCGLDEVVFKKDDLFREENGQLIDKNINIMSWMITNGHLQTDIGERLFKDPFVFAGGIKQDVSEDTREKVKAVSQKNTPAGPSVMDAEIAKQKTIERYSEESLNKVAANASSNAKFVNSNKALIEKRIAKIEEDREQFRSRTNGVYDKILLSATLKPGITVDNFKSQLTDLITKYVQYINEEGVIKVNINAVQIQELVNARVNNNTIQNIYIQHQLPILQVKRDGTITLIFEAAERVVTGTDTSFTGVFSKVREGLPLSDEEAREFLSKSLGIDQSNVLILNTVRDVLTNETVFGATQLFTDIISNEIDGMVVLSRQNNLASTYHEAFHYCNLLLRTDAEREALYKYYVENKRKDLKGQKRSVIEEALAEEFKEYCQSYKNQTVFGKIRRFFKDLLDFVNVFKKQDLVEKTFRQIRKGYYADRTIDNASLQDFLKRYPNGAFDKQLVVSGVPANLTKNIKHIKDARTWYAVANSLANEFLKRNAIRRVDDIDRIKDTPFNDFLEELQIEADGYTDPTKREIIEDILSNKEGFKIAIGKILKEYGIKAKFSKKKVKADDLLVEENKSPEQKNDEGQGEYQSQNFIKDIENFDVSKKDNVAFRAKLFLGQIERRIFDVDILTGERKAIIQTDKVLGFPIYEPFSNSWNKILNELWNIESFDEIDMKSKNSDNSYAKTSLRYNVKFRAKADPFYASLDKRLDETYWFNSETQRKEPDIELQNQILATIKSQMPTVGYTKMQNRKIKQDYREQESFGLDDIDSSAKTLSDKDKEFSLFTDNTFRAKRMLPREWSKNALVSGLAKYEMTKQGITQLTLNEVAVKSLQKLWYEARNILFNKATVKGKQSILPIQFRTEDEAKEAYNTFVDSIIEVMSRMGIPCDTAVLEQLVAFEDIKSNDNYINKVQTLQNLFSYKTGSIGYLIDNVMVKNIKNSELVFQSLNNNQKASGKKKKAPLNEIYYGYRDDTFITKYAVAFASVHPTSSDFSATAPDGKRIYPISQNNWISDQTRRLNFNIDGIVEKLSACPYQKRSVLLNRIAKTINHNNVSDDQLIKLVGFVGIKDADNNKGADYFKMTRIEDFISKMMMTFGEVKENSEGVTSLTNRMITLPTMADKKTYYAITHKGLNDIFADDIITNTLSSENGFVQARRFSDKTLRLFYDYFLDELDTITQYYSRDNIKHLNENPGKRRKNYHGSNVKGTKKMGFGGNGGLFRYCYDFIIDPETGLNLNQMLEAKYQVQQRSADKNKFTELDSEYEQDGFENVRSYLKDIYNDYSQANNGFDLMKDKINEKLVKLTDDELKEMDKSYDLKLVSKSVGNDGTIHYIPNKIPRTILQYYQDKLVKNLGLQYKAPVYSGFNTYDRESAYCAIANHTVNSLISMIEYEKVYSGDQAFYKWKYQKNTIKAVVDGVEVDLKVLKEKNSDRVKRLGAGLSPGDNVRCKYSDEITSLYPELKNEHYTNAYIDDISYMSEFKEDLVHMFTVDRAVEYIRYNKPAWFNLYKQEVNAKNDESLFNILYKEKTNESPYLDKLKDYLKEYKLLEQIEKDVELQSDAYNKINVSDAQVLIRPEMYRRIRIGLGQWSFVEDETGYSDEKAFRLIESDENWMSDAEKYAIGRRLQLYPLKMTYFFNNPEQESEQCPLAIPRYNKMAIFPLFKYTATSSSGAALYERMNRKGQELDMLTFDSAVKVGGNQAQPSAVVGSDLGRISDGILENSDQHLTKTGALKSSKSEINGLFSGNGKLPVQIQRMDGLLMQLNTEAHTEEERAIGSQMFKLGFSDVIEKALYGLNKVGAESRTGKQIRTELMACINALTLKGRKELETEHLVNTEDSDARDEKIRSLMKQVVRSNDLGSLAETILNEGYTIASLPSNRVFEQSVSSKVNSKVVEIHTNGGSAIQQSSYGFIGASVLSSENGYHAYNNGKKLKWLKSNGSMEVILSMNFFKAVVPTNYQTSYTRMRQWLINNDVIKGVKSKEYWKGTDEEKQTNALLDSSIENFGLDEEILKILYAHKVTNIEQLVELYNNKNINTIGKKTRNEIKDLFESLNIDPSTIKRAQLKPTKSNPKPFGIGYRIPTQGMSSMFAFTVADVLPETSGDLIIVPPEFTAQTGSDFDIDKLFLATFKYNATENESTIETSDVFDNPKLKKHNDIRDALVKGNVSEGAIQNRLLMDYIDIITDSRNIALSRASIDTFTSVIQDKIVDRLRSGSNEYLSAMSELTPVFQSTRKLEFATGKAGIAPFALSITNQALVQYSKLCMVYQEENPYNLGRICEITGQDGEHIMGWLSAMVNAHVDVAKDPYIFTLNVNPITYNMTTFLIRAGKGLSTFSFIAQPVLKEYCSQLNAAGGFFGNNDGTVKDPSAFNNKKLKIQSDLKKKYYNKMLQALAKQKDSIDEETKKAINSIKYKDGQLVIDATNQKSIFEKVFDVEEMLHAAEDIRDNEEDGTVSAKSYMLQLLTITSFGSLNKYADNLSQLVLSSRIDTKKFGKDRAEQYDFKNSLLQFMYNHNSKTSVDWYIHDENATAHDEALRIKKIRESHDKSALKAYFNNTFLWSKLDNAISLQRQMLYHQSFTSSKTFYPMFMNVMGQLFGKIPIEDGHNSVGYAPTYNKDSVHAISEALQSMFRVRALQNTKNWIRNKEKDDDYTGPIDFTYGGDIENALGHIYLMLNGAHNDEIRDKYKSILDKESYLATPLFTRLQNLLSYLEGNFGIDDNYAEISQGLVYNGQIINDFLNYIKPVPPSKKFPVGQILTKQSAYDRDTFKTDVLISAFNELLQHNSQVIRRIARELALYAFYSSYGNNSREQFFDLVPAYYRKQYDQAIKDDLYNEGKLKQHMGISIANAVGETSNYEKITDAIARNYWYDTNIIKQRVEDKGIKKIVYPYGLNKEHGLVRARMKILDNKYSNAYGIIITNNADGDYFTVRHGDDVLLYKKVGNITKTTFTQGKPSPFNRSGVYESNEHFAVYFIIPKLGRHNGSNHHYEMINDQQNSSIYYENYLPDVFEYSNLRIELDKWLRNNPKEQMQKIKNKKQVLGQEVEYETYSDSTIAGSYLETQNTVGYNYTNEDGSVKAVAISGNIIQAMFANNACSVVINNGVDLSKMDININNKEISNFEFTTQSLTDAILNKFKELNINEKTPVKIGFINKDVSDIQGSKDMFVKVLVNLISAGYNIGTVISTGNEGLEKSFLDAGRIMKDSLSFNEVQLYFPNEYLNIGQTQKYEDLMLRYDNDPNSDEIQHDESEINDAIDLIESSIEADEKLSDNNTIDEKEASDNTAEIQETLDDEAFQSTEVTATLDDLFNADGSKVSQVTKETTDEVNENEDRSEDSNKKC